MRNLITTCLICFCVHFLNGQTTLVRVNLFDELRYNNGQSSSDGLIILFEAGNNNGVDAFDAPKFFNLDETFARQNGATLLSIERRDLPVDNETLPFFNSTYRTQNYIFEVEAFQFSDFLTYFKDTYTGIVYEVGAGAEVLIPFSIDNSVPESIAANRFELSFIEKSDFIYDNGWVDLDPCINVITATDNLNVLSGTAMIDCDLIVKNITIAAGASLQIASGRTVTVNGDIINSGIINAQGSTIFINNVAAFYSNNAQLGNLSLNNGSDLDLSGKVDVFGNLQHTGTGTAIIENKNATLSLKSTAMSNAHYMPTDLQLTAPVVSETYMSAGRAFRFLSSPVTTTTSIFENWQENGNETVVGFGTDITGTTGVIGGFDMTNTNNPSMYSWDNVNQSWVAQTTTNTPNDFIESGKPYRLFVRGDRLVDLTSNVDAQRETVLRTTGILHSGDFTTITNGTDGAFNMIGNPYAAPYDLDGMLSNLNMSNHPVDATNTRPSFFYVWDPTLQSRGAYVTYDTALDLNLNSSSQVNGFLQPYQAAFVIANGNSGNFTFKESYLDIDQLHVQVSSVPQIMRVELLKNAAVKDGVIIKFNNGNSNLVDANDAPKVMNLEENLSILQSQNRSSIAARAMPVDGEIIVLDLNQLTTGNYKLKISPLSITGIHAYLKDQFTGQTTLLNTTGTSNYDFHFDTGNLQSSDASRFQIEFFNSTLGIDESAFAKAVSLHPNPSQNGIVTIKIPLNSTLHAVTVYNTLGQRLSNVELLENNSVMNLSLFAKGVYLLQINIDDKIISKKLIIE